MRSTQRHFHLNYGYEKEINKQNILCHILIRSGMFFSCPCSWVYVVHFKASSFSATHWVSAENAVIKYLYAISIVVIRGSFERKKLVRIDSLRMNCVQSDSLNTICSMKLSTEQETRLIYLLNSLNRLTFITVNIWIRNRIEIKWTKEKKNFENFWVKEY